MVCKLPSARSLSKARSEGALRENMAKADMSASVKEMSPSSQRGAGMVAKQLWTKGKSASAERYLRALGATMDIGNPITRTANRSSQGVFSHRCLRKASTSDTVITGVGGSAGIAGGQRPAGHHEGDGAERYPHAARGRPVCRGPRLVRGLARAPRPSLRTAALERPLRAGVGPVPRAGGSMEVEQRRT